MSTFASTSGHFGSSLKMTNEDREESVTIKISKQFYNGEPNHWWVEVTDIDGEFMGAATGPTFASVWDSTWGFITGDDDDWNGEHNTWVDFDANGNKESSQ